jgi:uncharacterized repeat protein (TIGR03803 family)
MPTQWETVTRALVLMVVLAVLTTLSHAQGNFTVIHNFTGPDGSYPESAPTLDIRGDLYGTTSYGGAYGEGLVYQLAHGSWALHRLYSFTGYDDGGQPYAGVTIGPDGTLYGATQWFGNGGRGLGTLLNLQPPAHVCETVVCPWGERTLYTFGNAGEEPEGNVVFDSQGNMYGTAFSGGTLNWGTVYKATRSGGTWNVSPIHTFAGYPTDGAHPIAGVVLDSAGNIYGTTQEGGPYGPPPPNGYGYGTVFELSPSGSGWTETILHSFANNGDGCDVAGGLVLDRAGNLFGGTVCGTIFELSPQAGGWNFTTLYFGEGVTSTLVIDSAGNLYGTSYFGGHGGYGNVFELSPSSGGWSYTDLYDFTGGTDGRGPNGVVVTGPGGYLYGTTYHGGTDRYGVVYQINLGARH